MTFKKSALLFGAAILHAFFLSGVLSAQNISPGNPLQQGSVGTPRVNNTFYPGLPAGWYTSIQFTVTDACAKGGGTVDIQAGATPTDTIGGVTGGCTTVGIIDHRVIPAVSYAWVTSAYIAQGSGGSVTAGAMQAALASQTGCTTNGYAWNPATNTCAAASVTAATVAAAISTQTGCATAGYVWVPQSNTCVAQSSSSGTVTHSTGALTANHVVIGNGTGDVKVDTGASTDGAGNLTANSMTGNGTLNGSDTLVYTGTPAAAPPTNGFQISPAIPVTTPWSLSPAAAPASGFLKGTLASGIVQQSFEAAVNLASSDVTGILPNANLQTGLTPTTLKLGTSSVLTGTSGTGTKLASFTGTYVPGDIAMFSANGDAIDSGGAFSNVPSLSAGQIWAGYQTYRTGMALTQFTPAVPGNNYNSPPFEYAASYCASSSSCSSADDNWSTQVVMGTGYNPTSTLTFLHASGTTGVSSVSIPYPITVASCTGCGITTASTPAPFVGSVVPVFQTVSSFDNLGAALGNPFCLASGGGLVACTQGTLASGYRRLPREANTSRVTRTDWKVIWDPTDTTGTMTLGIGLSTGLYNVTLSNTSSGTLQAVFASNGAGTTTTVSGVVGTSPLTLTVSVVTGNGGVTVSVLPQGAQIAQSNPDPWLTYQAVWQPMIQPRVTVAYFSSSSATSKIMGWLHNSNGLDGDPNGVLLTRTAARNLAGASLATLTPTATISNTNHENSIVIPERSNPSIPLKSVMLFHGRTGYGPTDFCSVPGLSAPGEPTDATCVALLAAGYAVIADQAGRGFTNTGSDYWGNIRGTQYAKETLDAFTKNVFNSGKVYALGQSMGGVGSLNFIRAYPNVVAAAYEATPAIDLNETTCPLGINCAGSTLQITLNATYQLTYISLTSSNVGNNPATDSGTNWAVLAEAGALPDVGGMSWQKTTVATAETGSYNVPVASGVGFAPGDWVYFEEARQLRRIQYGASGAPNTLVLDSPVTVAVGDLVKRITKLANGAPDPNSFDYNWANFAGIVWASGTTYSAGQFVNSPSSNPFNDEIAWNPLRSPESFGLTPIEIGIAGDGTCTGSDGILDNAQMCSFADAVNAIYPGTVTELHLSGSHVSGAMIPADILAFFAAH